MSSLGQSAGDAEHNVHPPNPAVQKASQLSLIPPHTPQGTRHGPDAHVDAFPLRLPAPLDGAWPQTVFEMAADEPEPEDDDEDDEEDEEDDEDDDEDEDKKDEDDDDEDDDEDEDEDEEDELEAEAEARTAHGQLKRQNGHRRGGHFNG